jgi:hypothetical protein
MTVGKWDGPRLTGHNDLAESRPLVATLTGSPKWVDDCTRAGTSDRVGVAAEHSHSRSELGSPERYHVLADVDSNLLTLVVMRVHENPLNEVIAVLVPSDVNQWDARAIWKSSGDDPKIAIQELRTTNLETFLNYLGSELIDAVVVGPD